MLKRPGSAGVKLGPSRRRERRGYALTEDLALTLGLLFCVLAPMRSRDNQYAAQDAPFEPIRQQVPELRQPLGKIPGAEVAQRDGQDPDGGFEVLFFGTLEIFGHSVSGHDKRSDSVPRWRSGFGGVPVFAFRRPVQFHGRGGILSTGAPMDALRTSEPTLMARTSSALPALLLVTALGAFARVLPADIEPVPDGTPPPPPRVKSGEALEPEVRAVRQQRETITEYRVNGHLRAIRIESDGFPAYWLIDADGNGQLDPRGNGRLGGRAGNPDPAGEMMPRWVIFNW